MVVVSLFNGMNTGRQGLEDEGFYVEKYYSSEIKPFAIKLTQYHFPDTIQVGDIRNWRNWDIDWSKVDILLSGSPCQDLSIAGKQKGINGKKSSLFFVFIDIYNFVKLQNPKVLFFQENVAKGVDPTDIIAISKPLNILPVRINSNLVVHQNRDRNYWCNFRVMTDWTGYNWTDIPPPKQVSGSFQDILENGFVLDEKAQSLLESEAKTFGYKNIKKFQDLIIRRLKANRQNPNLVYCFTEREKAKTILESESRPLKDVDKLFVRWLKNKTDNVIFSLENGIMTVRNLTKIELCRLQGFPDNYCDILTRNHAASLLGDGWTLPMWRHFCKYLPVKFKKHSN